MNDFFSTYGSLIVMMVQAGLLGLSLYFPLQAGQLSLATPGFYALGGYVAAILLTNPAFSGLRETLGNGMFPLTWLVAALLSGVLGLVLGLPALRLRGIYLALATIAFVQIMQTLALNLKVTGGAIGIFAIPQAFGFERPLQYLWLFGPLLHPAVCPSTVAFAGGPGLSRHPGRRTRRRRDGHQPHPLQGAGLRDRRGAGGHRRRDECAVSQHLERQAGHLRRLDRGPRLRADRRLAPPVGTGGGRAARC